ncbi:MAG: hypothetical protein H7Y32_12140 [Chloroflexales bacterium]|nr:hypothetical protein [Chloroflexales bacterium]
MLHQWPAAAPARALAIVATSPAAPNAPVPQATATPTRTPTPVNIGNFIWSDLNGNGIQNAGEPGLAGVTVQLWTPNKATLLDAATTDDQGKYTVTAPLPGDYRVRVVLPAGGVFTLKDQGVDDMVDSDINTAGGDFGFTEIFTLASNVISTTIFDAGIYLPTTPTPTRTPTPISLGNFIWHDLNGDGVQTAGEPGIGGVTVQLWNSAKTELLASATSNSGGIYLLIAPLAGDYRIRVVAPPGASFALKGQGAATLDSDINRVGADVGFTEIFTIGSNVISINSIDAGLLNVQPSPTPTETATSQATPTQTATPSTAKIYLPLAQR